MVNAVEEMWHLSAEGTSVALKFFWYTYTAFVAQQKKNGKRSRSQLRLICTFDEAALQQQKHRQIFLQIAEKQQQLYEGAVHNVWKSLNQCVPSIRASLPARINTTKMCHASKVVPTWKMLR
ncbi:hypothetical protein Ancab_000118 [Ancistrocladus abbreviatus]